MPYFTRFAFPQIFARTPYFSFVLWIFNIFFLLCNRVYEGYSFSTFGWVVHAYTLAFIFHHLAQEIMLLLFFLFFFFTNLTFPFCIVKGGLIWTIFEAPLGDTFALTLVFSCLIISSKFTLRSIMQVREKNEFRSWLHWRMLFSVSDSCFAHDKLRIWLPLGKSRYSFWSKGNISCPYYLCLFVLPLP